VADNPPRVICDAAYTKNGKEAVLPIPKAVARALVPWLASRPTGRPVFDLPDKTGEMIKHDLARAGIEADSGAIDMHSLRHGYITMLAKSGVSLAMLKQLARHSSLDLTLDTYAHLSVHDEAAAVAGLPDLETAPEQGSEAAAATGSDGAIIDMSKDFSLSSPYRALGIVRSEPDTGGRVIPLL
jgi:integrase